jgi:hypothetical protein
MEARDPNIWFPAKRYGWGWGLPCSWQGWVVMALWLAIFSAGGFATAGRNPFLFGGFVLLMSLAMIGICFAKGEKPRWRWGKD